MPVFYTLIAKALKKLRLFSSRNSQVHRTSKIESGSSIICSKFDRYSFCGYDCDIYYSEIGSFTSIASNVVIGGARHPMEWVGMSPVFYKGRDSIKKKFSQFDLAAPIITCVGHDVWIGRSAIVNSGVTIGNGAVIGAGSVVTKDVPPYAIVVGNPARIIRHRFAAETVAALEDAQWWLLDDYRLRILAAQIRNPEQFLAELKKTREVPTREKSQ